VTARGLLPSFFVVVGTDERLTIVPDALGLPGALRFRTRDHAEQWLAKHNADERDFGRERGAA
jgi:hypothetical protein